MLKNLLKRAVHFVLDTLEIIIMALAMFAVGYLFLVQPHQVNGNSMLPSFKDKELLITEKVSYRFREPQRGEVIIFKYPKAHEYDYIKRLIGLPEEKIIIKSGKIKIFNDDNPNGFYLDEEPYLQGNITKAGPIIQEGKIFEIPEGEYVAIGDNREKSSDSRNWGTIKKNELVGRAWFRYWPPQTFTTIKKAEY